MIFLPKAVLKLAIRTTAVQLRFLFLPLYFPIPRARNHRFAHNRPLFLSKLAARILRILHISRIVPDVLNPLVRAYRGRQSVLNETQTCSTFITLCVDRVYLD